MLGYRRAVVGTRAYNAQMSYTRVGDLLVGLVALALLRSRVEDLGGRSFNDARIAELRRILGNWEARDLQAEADWTEVGAETGYAAWAPTYDGPNPLIDLDDSRLRPILRRYPQGAALDAACGTGRWAVYLAQLGHAVQGVDATDSMLDVARAKLPEARFVRGDLRRLPVEDSSVDLVVCSLALVYVPDLRQPFTEFARVLRPGGHAVISDIHHLSLPLGGIVQLLDDSGRQVRITTHVYFPTDYLSAALYAGLSVRACAEVPWPDLEAGHGGPTAQAWCPDAARIAYTRTPALIQLELEKPT